MPSHVIKLLTTPQSPSAQCGTSTCRAGGANGAPSTEESPATAESPQVATSRLNNSRIRGERRWVVGIITKHLYMYVRLKIRMQLGACSCSRGCRQLLYIRLDDSLRFSVASTCWRPATSRGWQGVDRHVAAAAALASSVVRARLTLPEESWHRRGAVPTHARGVIF